MEPQFDRNKELADNIKNGKYKNIIILSGAGVSTNSGIPDYRSSTGQFTIFPAKVFEDRKVYESFKEQNFRYLRIKLQLCPTNSPYILTTLDI
jgi:NAD-dependent SIR2 family protein deacetylase